MLSRLFAPTSNVQPVEIPKRTIAETMTGFDCDGYGSKAVHTLAISALEGARDALSHFHGRNTAPVPKIITHIIEELRYNHQRPIMLTAQQVGDLHRAAPDLERIEDALKTGDYNSARFYSREVDKINADALNLFRGLAGMITSDYPPLVKEHEYGTPKGPSASVLKHS